MSLRALPDGTYLAQPPSRNTRVIIGRKTGTICYSGKPGGDPIILTTPLVAGDTPVLRDRS